MSDLVQRLRDGLEAGAVDMADIMDAADEIVRLRESQNSWQMLARAFDEHLATMRVMLLEHPAIRFGCNQTYAETKTGIESITLTDAEREAIKAGISCCEDITYGGPADGPAADVLRGLLERTQCVQPK